jgi:hypothetical protein
VTGGTPAYQVPWRARRYWVCLFAASWALTASFGGPAAGQDGNLRELYRQYHEISTEFKTKKALYENLKNSDSPDRADAQIQMTRLSDVLHRIKTEIRRAGGTPPDPGRMLETKPGAPVTALDKKTGTALSRPTGSRCAVYPDFVRPRTSIYTLPPPDRQSGHNRQLAKRLLQTEALLVGHLVKCEPDWTRRMVLDWDGERQALSHILVDLELRYALAFTTGYNAREDRLVGKAFENGAWKADQGDPEALRNLYRSQI